MVPSLIQECEDFLVLIVEPQSWDFCQNDLNLRRHCWQVFSWHNEFTAISIAMPPFQMQNQKVDGKRKLLRILTWLSDGCSLCWESAVMTNLCRSDAQVEVLGFQVNEMEQVQQAIRI